MVIINLVLLGTLVIVVLLWGFNWVTIWAGVPLLAAAVLSEFVLSPGEGKWEKPSVVRRLAVFGMVCGVVSVTLYFQVGLYFGFGWSVTEGSRAGRNFMIFPLFSFLGGILGYVVGSRLGRRLSPPEDSSRSDEGPGEAGTD